VRVQCERKRGAPPVSFFTTHRRCTPVVPNRVSAPHVQMLSFYWQRHSQLTQRARCRSTGVPNGLFRSPVIAASDKEIVIGELARQDDELYRKQRAFRCLLLPAYDTMSLKYMTFVTIRLTTYPCMAILCPILEENGHAYGVGGLHFVPQRSRERAQAAGPLVVGVATSSRVI
jgi:hypothetical protein